MRKLYKPSNLQNYLSSLNTKAKKSLSQNFLIDQNIIDKFITSADLIEDDIVLEIGPGLGAITEKILERSKRVIAIEKDDILAGQLKKEGFLNLEVITADFLKFDLSSLEKYNKKIKVIASIPYKITSLIIAKLLAYSHLFSSITLMIQKEVAERIVAKVNTKAYSSFSIFVNFYADTKIESIVSKNSFFPIPKVNSALIKLTIKKEIKGINRETFHKFVRIGFQQRRKKLISNLKAYFDLAKLKKAFLSLQIDENARAENISLNQFLSLFKNI